MINYRVLDMLNVYATLSAMNGDNHVYRLFLLELQHVVEER